MTSYTLGDRSPALVRYLRRIGATEKNFLRYVKQEQIGQYYREQSVITLSREGDIKVTDPADTPTPAEQEAIKIEFAALEPPLPAHKELRQAGVQDLLPLMRAKQQDGRPPIYFEFINRRTNNLIMVQQRVETDDGKRYLSWSFWDDDKWRNMEPGVDLPFWKPKEETDLPIMVHEGANVAKFVTAMCADPYCTHPWIKKLRKYEHWGMIGGAYSPHRADYKELHDRNLKRLVYVCDNDEPGMNALQMVSKHYGRTLWGVQFDQTWPPHWDMADPIPDWFFTDAGRYIGPDLDDLIRHATYATDVIRPPKGNPTFVIRPDFAKEWVQVREPEVFVNVNTPDKLLSEKAFNGWVRSFSDVDDTARILRRVQANKAASLLYHPAKPSGLINDQRDNAYVNTYVAPRLVAEAGDCTPWIEYLGNTFPTEADRREVIRWCATLVCHPEIKMSYGLLLIGPQGVGKSTLGSDILKPMLGKWNCCEPSEATVTNSNFNGWCAHKRLAIVHEIYAGHSAKAYDELKSVITERTLRINEKYLKSYELEIWLHVLACSNSKRALKLSMDDRRWLVPAVTEKKRHPDEWKRLHEWLNNEGGHGKIKHWMHQWLAENGGPVMKADAPLLTDAKREVIEEGYGPGQQLVVQTLSDLTRDEEGNPYRGKRLIVTDAALQKKIIGDVYQNRRPDKLETLATIRNTAKGEGWHPIKQRVKNKEWRELEAVTRALTTDLDLVDVPIAELVALAADQDSGVKFVDVKGLI